MIINGADSFQLIFFFYDTHVILLLIGNSAVDTIVFS